MPLSLLTDKICECRYSFICSLRVRIIKRLMDNGVYIKISQLTSFIYFFQIEFLSNLHERESSSM